MTVLHLDSIGATRLYGQYVAGATDWAGAPLLGNGSHPRRWKLKGCSHCGCDLYDRGDGTFVGLLCAREHAYRHVAGWGWVLRLAHPTVPTADAKAYPGGYRRQDGYYGG